MNQDAKEYLKESFEKIKQLHSSEKSEIWLVNNLFDQKIYVMKEIKQAQLPYKQLKDIQHKILPKIFYVVEDEVSSIVIEEYISGKTLAEIYKEENFIEEKLLIHIVLQLCDGLRLLHKHHIIHRDIKPSNLILTNDDLIKLIDFDASRIEKDNRQSDTRYLGTKGYAPPEQYGFGQTDARSDIYALGITMKKLLGGNYRGSLLRIIEKCTVLNPQERFQNIEELREKIKNRNKTHKWLAVILGIIICIVASFLGIKQSKTISDDNILVNPERKEDKTELKEAEILKEEMLNEEDMVPKINDNSEGRVVQSSQIEENEKPQNKSKDDTVTIYASCEGVEIHSFHKTQNVIFQTCKDWRTGTSEEYSINPVYFPSGTNIFFEIKNDTTEDLINPCVEIVGYYLDLSKVGLKSNQGQIRQEDNDRIYWRKKNSLDIGETMNLVFPLKDALILMPKQRPPSIIIAFQADNYKRKFVTFDFYFKDWNGS